MSHTRTMSGVRMEIEDYDDPIIVVRPLYAAAPVYDEFGRILPETEVHHTEIMVTTQEGCTVYMRLGYEIFRELHDKMSVLVHDPEEEPK